MIRIEIKDDTITEGLQALARQLDDLTPLMEEIGDILVASTKARFQEGKGPDGTNWAPKSPTTLAAYARRKDRASTKPLIGPSRMLSSQIFAEPGPRSVAVGSNQIYSAVMQFGAGKGAFGANTRGSPIPWGNIPARPFLGVSDADRAGILAAIEEWLARASGADVV